MLFGFIFLVSEKVFGGGDDPSPLKSQSDQSESNQQTKCNKENVQNGIMCRKIILDD